MPVSLPSPVPRVEVTLDLGAGAGPVDLRTRALVAAVVPAPRFAREGEVVAAAAAATDAGADVVDVSHEPKLIGAAARAGRGGGLPVVSRVATAAQARAAHHAGAAVLLVPAQLVDEVAAEGWAAAVVVDDVVDVEAARVQAERHGLPVAIDTTSVGSSEALAVESAATAAGCRIVRTADIRRSRRVVEVVAALLEARR